MSKRNESVLTFKAAVERQAGLLRSLAREIEIAADQAGFRTKGAVSMMRTWSTTLRTIADELTFAANASGKDGVDKARLLSRFGRKVAAATMVFVPTVAAGAVFEYELPERIIETVNEIDATDDLIDGYSEIDISDGAQSTDRSVQDTISDQLDGLAIRDDSLLRLTGFPGDVSYPGSSVQRVGLIDADFEEWEVEIEGFLPGMTKIQLPVAFGEDDVEQGVTNWLADRIDRAVDIAAADIETQAEIDRRRGK